MLKTAFIGLRNNFDLLLAHWLSKETELKFRFWTNKLFWANIVTEDRKRRVIGHFQQRAKKYGILQSINEILYFFYYRTFIQKKDQVKLNKLIENYWTEQKEAVSTYETIFINDINSDDLVEKIKDNKIDVMIAMCLHAKLPQKLYSAPRLGTFLWHEGVVPEYKGIHSAFWALYNQDYDKLGYTLLKMGDKFDKGPIYIQGQVQEVDPLDDFWSYIAHKAIYDSLPEMEIFLRELETSNLKEIDRSEAPSGSYTYPGFTQLISLLLRRKIEKARRFAKVKF